MAFTFTTAAKLRYYANPKNDEILTFIQTKMGSHTTKISSKFAEVYRTIIFSEVASYLSKDVYTRTITELEKLFVQNNAMKLDEAFYNSFFVGYQTYCQTRDIIADLSGLNDSVEIKNRMYRLPTYISLVEGCLTNLYKAILKILDNATAINYSAQTKLNPICDALRSNGFDLIIRNVDTEIRNAINHGGIIFKKSLYAGDEIDFHFSKGNTPCVKTVKIYEFDRLIDATLDDVGGVLLGICDFINNHINSTSVDMTKSSLAALSLYALELSNADISCKWISENSDGSQLNVDFFVANTDREYLHQQAFLLSLMIYEKYPNYEKYFLGFSSLRMLSGWVRFTKQELDDMSKKTKPVLDVFQQAIQRKDVMIFEASTEEIDMQEIKYFRFPNYTGDNYKINNIKNASIDDRKRLRAHMFIGDISDKGIILDAIRDGIEWLKSVKNPPSPTIPHKYGTMEADSLYINVYKNDTRGNKELFSNNENFVCFIDYNISGETTLVDGGIPKGIWSQLHHERIENIQVAWREGKYVIRKTDKVGANDPCPCGSGKKYKKCCRR